MDASAITPAPGPASRVARGDDEARLVFQHLPKSGGTSLHLLLLALYPETLVFPGRDWGDPRRADAATLARCRFFSGHYDRHDVDRIPEPKRVIAIFREPRERLVSLYHFWRAHRDSVIASERYGARQRAALRLSKRKGLLDFLRFRGRPLRGGAGVFALDTLRSLRRYRPGPVVQSFDNAVVRMLAGVKPKNRDGELDCPAEEALERAIERLEAMACFGLLERFADFVEVLRERLGLPLAEEIPHALDRRRFGESHELEAVETEPITAEVAAELDRLTVLDRRLYDYARARFDEKFLRR